jgi:hypothetical protein
MAPRWSLVPLRWKKSMTVKTERLIQHSKVKKSKRTRRTGLLCDSPPRHLPRRIRLLPLLPQQPSKVHIILLSLPSREHELSRELPFSAKESESNGVGRDGSGAETLHAVVVDEAVGAEGGDRVVDGRDGGGFDVAVEERKRSACKSKKGDLDQSGMKEEVGRTGE